MRSVSLETYNPEGVLQLKGCNIPFANKGKCHGVAFNRTTRNSISEVLQPGPWAPTYGPIAYSDRVFRHEY
jgi:hypothetical protein